MSDFYDDLDDDRNQENRRRRRNFEEGADEGWGMAYDMDAHDADASRDAEDYAAGLAEEEGANYQNQWQDGNYRGNVGNIAPPLRGSSRTPGQTPPDYRLLEGDSPAMQRANQLRNRYGNVARTEVTTATSKGDRIDRNTTNSDFFDTLFNFQFGSLRGLSLGSVPQYILLLVGILILLLFGCVIAAWITAIEVREALGLTSYLVLGR